METDERSPAGSQRVPDEIDLVQIVLVLWSHRIWITSCATVITLLGTVYAFVATPRYYSQATIVFKEKGQGGGASSILSQFGGIGGGVVSQLGVGNANVAKMGIVLKSEDLAKSVIKANNLMPLLYDELWDSPRGSWKSDDPKKIPTLRNGAILLSTTLLTVNGDEKKGIMRIGATMNDPALAKKVVEGYLTEMNNKIRLDVTNEADSNRKYLERQLNNTSDPVLIEKIQNLISIEIEKTMLISSSAFDVLEKPAMPLRKAYPKRKRIVLISFFVGLVFSVAVIFLWKGGKALKALIDKAEIESGSASRA